MSVKTDTQKSTSRPGSIQCKNNLHFVPLSQAQQARKTFVFLFSRNLLLTKIVSVKRIPVFPCDAIQFCSQGSLLVVHLSRSARE